MDLESSGIHSDVTMSAARDAAAASGLQIPAKAALFPPKFNRLVVFSVPRYHQVTPVVPQPAASGAPRLRLSIFGWFLQPGRLYPLLAADSADGIVGGGKSKKVAAAACLPKPAAPSKRKRGGE